MKIIQSRSFEQRAKRFNQAQKVILDEQVKLILENPDIGDEKKGALSEIYVHKFNIMTIQYLLAYRIVRLFLKEFSYSEKHADPIHHRKLDLLNIWFFDKLVM